MTDQQSKITPPLWIALVFILLAISFMLDVWGHKKRYIKERPAVAAKFVSNETVRDPLESPETQQGRFVYNCNSCHRNITPSNDHRKWTMAHKNVKMDHGINNRCFNCHQENNREMLKDINGDPVPFSKSELVCQHCHGPKYRDWMIGVHGRPNGYWDKSRAGKTVKATCVACHDPHAPRFQPLEPAPAPVPVKENFYWKE